jgi:hypothetical protein
MQAPAIQSTTASKRTSKRHAIELEDEYYESRASYDSILTSPENKLHEFDVQFNYYRSFAPALRRDASAQRTYSILWIPLILENDTTVTTTIEESIPTIQAGTSQTENKYMAPTEAISQQRAIYQRVLDEIDDGLQTEAQFRQYYEDDIEN